MKEPTVTLFFFLTILPYLFSVKIKLLGYMSRFNREVSSAILHKVCCDNW